MPDTLVLLYQLLTLLVGFGAQGYVLASHTIHPSPLGSRFLRFSLPFTLFYLLIGLAAYVLRTPGFDLAVMEPLGNTLFFVLYAAMVPPWAAFLLELVQKPYRGPWKTLARGLATLGLVVPAVLWAYPLAQDQRLEALRMVLQVGYLPLLLAFVVILAVLVWKRSRTMTDRWKRTTARGVILILSGAFPLFVLDALWPWLQLGGGWVPRAFNFHGLFYVGFHLFVALRWTSLARESRKPLTPPPVPRVPDKGRLKTLGLTFREEEVLGLVFAGQSNQQIADGLGLTLGTTKNHVYRIFQKSGASSRKELMEMLEASPAAVPASGTLLPPG